MESKFKLRKMESEKQDDPHRVIRAAVYARYSSVGNSHCSADEQIQRIRFRLAHGQIFSKKYPSYKIEVDENWVIKDEAKTGRVTREGYDLTKAGITNQEFDILLVDDISRLTRDMGATIDLYDVLTFKNVEGISISDAISTLDSNAKDIWVFKGYANEALSKATSKNVQRGLEMRVIGGFSTGHNPYGYTSKATRSQTVKGVEKPSHYEIHIKPDEAAIVIRIWELFAEGHGQKSIARILNEEGIAPPGRGLKKQWAGRTVYKMLQQQKYLGIWPYRQTKVVRDPFQDRLTQQERPKAEWLVMERPDLRIIPAELEKRVEARWQAAHSKPKVSGNLARNDSHPKHLFVGSLICHECGGNITMVSGKGYMGCYNAHRTTSVKCGNSTTVNAVLLEECLIDELWRVIDRPETYQYLAMHYNAAMGKKHGDIPGRLEAIEAELATVTRSLENFVNFIAEGNFSPAIASKLKEAEEKASRLTKERDYLKEQIDSQVYITPTAIKARLQGLPSLLKQKTMAANAVIRRIFPEKLRLVLTCPGKKKVYEAKGVVQFHTVMGNGTYGELQALPFSRLICWESLESTEDSE